MLQHFKIVSKRESGVPATARGDPASFQCSFKPALYRIYLLYLRPQIMEGFSVTACAFTQYTLVGNLYPEEARESLT